METRSGSYAAADMSAFAYSERIDMDWNYDETAEKLEMHKVNIDEKAIPFVLEEARKRQEGDVIMGLANWFEGKDDRKNYLELCMEAAELGSEKANYELGLIYRDGYEYAPGETLPRDFEKAYSCFLKVQDIDWVPINFEENAAVMEGDCGEVNANTLLDEGDIKWWMFLLEKHPTRALKCGLADWYMKQGGDLNREKALQLFEQSANEGFEFAFVNLIQFYKSREFKDLDKARYWFCKAEEQGFDEDCFADELGVESNKCRKLKAAADAGDCMAAAKLACAYLTGQYGEEVTCAKNKDLALHYGNMVCGDEAAIRTLVAELDDSAESLEFLDEVIGID